MKRLSVLICKVGFILLFGVFGFIASNNIGSPIPVAEAQSCSTPSQVTNVLVEFPSCVGDVCNFTQASCSWSSVSGASNYQLTVTEVETGSAVVSETVAASTTSRVFNITQNRTYRCDVAAVNSCGASGLAGSHSLLCEVDALVDPTTAPAAPTSVPNVPTAAPTIPPSGAGGAAGLLMGGIGAVIATGGVLFYRFKK